MGIMDLVARQVATLLAGGSEGLMASDGGDGVLAALYGTDLVSVCTTAGRIDVTVHTHDSEAEAKRCFDRLAASLGADAGPRNEAIMEDILTAAGEAPSIMAQLGKIESMTTGQILTELRNMGPIV